MWETSVLQITHRTQTERECECEGERDKETLVDTQGIQRQLLQAANGSSLSNWTSLGPLYLAEAQPVAKESGKSMSKLIEMIWVTVRKWKMGQEEE